jgi:hypothetical protein
MVVAPALHRSALRFWLSDSDEAIERRSLCSTKLSRAASTRARCSNGLACRSSEQSEKPESLSALHCRGLREARTP